MRLDFNPQDKKMFHICLAMIPAGEEFSELASPRVNFFIVTTACFWKLWLTDLGAESPELGAEYRLSEGGTDEPAYIDPLV